MSGTVRPPQAATAQGLLALDFGPGPDLPSRPNLRLVTGDEPDLNGFATRFAQAIVEVIGGDRSVYQLMRWTTDDVYEDLYRRSSTLQRAAATGDPRRRRLRAQVRSVHLSSPIPNVAEVSIHVRHGRRSRAIAVRIERVEGRWRCSAIEFG
jgi:hypothetical protein